MAALLTTAAPPPHCSPGERPDVYDAYFAITINAAVDLLEPRAYQGLPRADRLAKALSEQQSFLNEFFDACRWAALDLRIVVEEQAATPITVGLTGLGPGLIRPGSPTRQPGCAPSCMPRVAPRDGYPGTR